MSPKPASLAACSGAPPRSITCPIEPSAGLITRGVGMRVAEDPGTVVEQTLSYHAIGIAAHLNCFDRRKSLGVEHDERLTAGDAVAGFGGNYRSVSAGARDFAHGSERVEIESTVMRAPYCNRTGLRSDGDQLSPSLST